MASVSEIRKFIDAYHADNQRKFVISYSNDTYKVDLMWKLSDKDLFMSQIRFDDIEEMIVMLDMDVEHYDAIDEYLRTGEKLHVERLVNDMSGLVVEQFSFGDKSFRFFASSTLDELNDTIISAHTYPLSQYLPSQFVTIEGNKLMVEHTGVEDNCELQYRTRNGNLVGYMSAAPVNDVLEYLTQVNWYGVITPDDIPVAKDQLLGGHTMVITTCKGAHVTEFQKDELVLVN